MKGMRAAFPTLMAGLVLGAAAGAGLMLLAERPETARRSAQRDDAALEALRQAAAK